MDQNTNVYYVDGGFVVGKFTVCSATIISQCNYEVQKQISQNNNGVQQLLLSHTLCCMAGMSNKIMG